MNASGLLELDGSVKGTLAENVIPAFNAHLKIENGSFKYPDLPTAVNDIQLSADIKNSTNSISGIEVDIPKAHIKVADEPIDFSLGIKNPVEDPDVDLKANGQFDLSKVPDFFPIEGVNELAGNMQIDDLVFKGKVSDIENERFSNIDASGQIDVQNLKVSADDLPMPFSASKVHMTFTPQYVALDELNGQLGESDLQGSGRLDNLIAYLFFR